MFLPSDPDKIYDHYHQLSYRDALARDERRYKAADTDGNGQLNREEFPAFLHPGRWLRRGEQGEKGGQREEEGEGGTKGRGGRRGRPGREHELWTWTSWILSFGLPRRL